MAPPLTYDECLKDSPSFREMLHNAESDTVNLEGILEKVLKQCNFMNEAERFYNSANELLIESIKDMCVYYKDDSFVKNVLNHFAHVLKEISSFHMTLDQAQRSINTQMSHFLKTDLKKNQDLKKMFDKVSNEYDTALGKQASASRFKPHEIEETESSLATHKATFRNLSMEYVSQMNMLHKNKRSHAVDKISSYMHALHTFFHQGYELFKDVDPFLKATGNKLTELNKEIKSENETMMVQRERYQAMAGDNSMYIKEVEGNNNIIEGYLFKRASNAFKTWSRRWFSVNNNRLLYQSKLKSHNQEDTMIVVDDLRLCTIRVTEEVERRFCFDVISPTKSVLLQAESEDVRQAWVNAIQASIREAYKQNCGDRDARVSQSNEVSTSITNASNGVKSAKNSPTVSHTSVSSDRRGSRGSAKNQARNSPGSTSLKTLNLETRSPLQKIVEIPGNLSCADCKKQEARWASVNLGIVLCIECSGVHRSLGVHISKVRSLTLDSWEPEVISIMQTLGNDRVNEIYEAKLDSIRIRPGCSNKDRLEFIQAKYVRKEFCATLPNLSSEEINPTKELRRWKIRKSKPRRRRERRKKAESYLSDEDQNQNVQKNKSLEGEKDKPLENDVFVFGLSKIPDPDGETEVENSDVEEIHNLDPNILFYKAAKLGNLPVMLLAKANGADVNWGNPKDSGRTPLMQATISGSIRACEFLLINGARINKLDADGRSPLHYSAIHNHTGIACQFIKRKALLNIIDKDNLTALQIAIDAANADIVTLIRLIQMNDEMMDSDPGSTQTDSIVTDVLRDFSLRAAAKDLHSLDGTMSPELLSPTSPPPTPIGMSTNEGTTPGIESDAAQIYTSKTANNANRNNNSNLDEESQNEDIVHGFESTV